jgi:hypothetical protein
MHNNIKYSTTAFGTFPTTGGTYKKNSETNSKIGIATLALLHNARETISICVCGA